MRTSRFNSLPQLAGVLAGFAVSIVLLESEALCTWAERLDVSPARDRAVRITAALRKTIRPSGIEQVRRETLSGLDRLGWTDDPARLVAAKSRKSIAGTGPSSPCLNIAQIPGLRSPKTIPTSIPLIANLPRSTPLTPLPTPQSQPRVVALVGDSMMAVGLSNVFLRQTAGNENIRVIRAFRSGTGLARPDVFDWMQEYPVMIGDERPDAIIVAIGANDGQGLVEDGKALPFGSDAWVKVYEQRTADFLNLLARSGAHIVWVGLPSMKSASYNSRIAEINRVSYAVISQNPQATWWNPQPYIGGVSDGFREFESTPNGRLYRIRAADGIHLSDDGAALLTPALIEWLNSAPPVNTAQITPPAEPSVILQVKHRERRGRTARP